MAEWSIAPVLKTGGPQGPVSSNLTASAKGRPLQGHNPAAPSRLGWEPAQARKLTHMAHVPHPPAAPGTALLAGGSPKDEAPGKAHLVSLGAYREAGNVAILRAKLKAEGYSSYTETVGDKVRVRAGPFPNKAAADKAAVRIQKILGVQASVAAKQ